MLALFKRQVTFSKDFRILNVCLYYKIHGYTDTRKHISRITFLWKTNVKKKSKKSGYDITVSSFLYHRTEEFLFCLFIYFVAIFRNETNVVLLHNIPDVLSHFTHKSIRSKQSGFFPYTKTIPTNIEQFQWLYVLGVIFFFLAIREVHIF